MYYNLGNQQELQCLHTIMGSDTKRFYLNTVQPHMNTYTHAVELVIQKYKSAVRNYRVKNVLSRLRTCKKLEENQDECEALAKVYKTIIKLYPQVPVSQCGNAHMIEFLRKTIVG